MSMMPRRKSSAQNLLSSFKNSSSSSSASIPPPLNLNLPPMNSFAAAITPSGAATPLPLREWDTQSMHSESIPSALAGAQSPPLGQGPTVEVLRDLVQKRIMSLTYIRNIHEGRSHWFHTIFISRAELERVFNNHQMRKRTYRFAILGLSLSTLLDINQPHDLLRGLINIITEYDQSKEESESRSRVLRRFNKPKTSKKGTSGMAEFAVSYAEDASYLLSPSMPFPLDYHQTLLSLLDVLSEIYNKIAKLLGPSPFAQSAAQQQQQQSMMGPLGPLLPYPGVSYLFPGGAGAGNGNGNGYGHDSDPNLQHQGQGQQGYQGQGQGYQGQGQQGPGPGPGQQGYNGSAEAEMSGSLWGIANGGASAGGAYMIGGTLSSPPATGWTSALGDMVVRIDVKLKKITTVLLKDLDTFARNGIRDELASLDPLLRNVAGDGGPAGSGLMYDFDGN